MLDRFTTHSSDLSFSNQVRDFKYISFNPTLQIFDCVFCVARNLELSSSYKNFKKDYKKFTFFDINPLRMKKSLGLDMIALF